MLQSHPCLLGNLDFASERLLQSKFRHNNTVQAVFQLLNNSETLLCIYFGLTLIAFPSLSNQPQQTYLFTKSGAIMDQARFG